jgi:uncharacterized protein YceK
VRLAASIFLEERKAMNLRLPPHRASALFVLSVLMLLAVLWLSGCGTTRKETEAYQKSVTAVDENGAIRTLRLIASAQASYAATNNGEYGTFEDLTSRGMLDQRFASHTPELGGYVFTIRIAPASGEQGAMFAVNADPKTPASGIQTNGRHFYLDAGGVIHANNSRTASESDPMLNN